MQPNFEQKKTKTKTRIFFSSIMISLKISHPTFALLFIYSFALDHTLLESHIINHCSDSIKQEVSQDFLGLSTRLPLCDK